jgi:hypothetical protein
MSLMNSYLDGCMRVLLFPHARLERAMSTCCAKGILSMAPRCITHSPEAFEAKQCVGQCITHLNVHSYLGASL